MGRATEELAHRAGPGIGGLLNVTFGNAPELIIALFALQEGLQEVVKASIIGSVLGNLLLVLGAAMLIGGWGRERQKFVAEAARAQATMLLLATVALVLPGDVPARPGRRPAAAGAGGDALPARGRAHVVRGRDRAAAVLLRRPVVLAEDPQGRLQPGRGRRGERRRARGACRRSVGLLAVAGVAVGFMSEILVGSIEEASEGHRPLAVLRQPDHRRRRRQRRRALGRGLLRRPRQDGHLDLDRDRLERPDRAVRDARAGPAELRDRARSRWRSSSARSRSAPCCSRC